jgi:hypothetical protein
MRPGRSWPVLALIAGVVALVLVLTLGVAACGDDEEDEASDVPTISVPTSEPQTVPQQVPTQPPKPNQPATPTKPSKPTGGQGPGSSGGFDPSKPDSPANDVPPPPGSPQQSFEQFCNKNPAACG